MGTTESKDTPDINVDITNDNVSVDNNNQNVNVVHSTEAKQKNVPAAPTDYTKIITLAISSIPLPLIQIACVNFIMDDFEPHRDIIDILVNKHPSKTSVKDIYVLIKAYNKQQRLDFESNDAPPPKNDLAKTLLHALKLKEKLKDQLNRPVIQPINAKQAFQYIIHYLIYLIDNIPKGLDINNILDEESNAFENIVYPEYTIEQAEKHIKFLEIIFSLIRTKAKEGNLRPEYQGAFSGSKSPEELIKMYESESGVGPSHDSMSNRLAQKTAENMRHKLGITHFDVDYGDTASVVNHLGKRNIYDIIRSSEKDIMRRTPYAFVCGLLLLQNYSIKSKITIMCYSIGSLNPEIEIKWEKLIVHFLASALFAHCIALGEMADAVAYKEDFPQLPQEVCNMALRRALISNDEILVFTSSESEEEEEEDLPKTRHRGLTQGMNPSQIYMHMTETSESSDNSSNGRNNASSSNRNRTRSSSMDSNLSDFSDTDIDGSDDEISGDERANENAEQEAVNQFKIKKNTSKWAHVRKRMAQERAVKAVKDFSKMNDAERLSNGFFNVAIQHVSNVVKKRRKVKTEFRWKLLRTKWWILPKIKKQEASEKLIESFTAVVSKAVKQKHIQDEANRRKMHPLYVKMKGHNRYLPLSHTMDGVGHIEPLCRALSLISLWMYSEGYGGPKLKQSAYKKNATTQEAKKKITLNLVLYMMSRKNIPSANLTSNTHSFAVHVAHFGYDARIHAMLTLTKSLPLGAGREETIWVAAKNNNIECIENILRSGVDINTREHGAGRTCLHIAAAEGYVPLVFWLLVHGANAWDASTLGMNALHYACKHGQEAVACLLLDWELDISNTQSVVSPEEKYINFANPLTKATPLHYAVLAKSKGCVQQLLLRFANTSFYDNDHRTCSDIASGYKLPGIVELINSDKLKYANHAQEKYNEARKLGIMLLNPPLSMPSSIYNRNKLSLKRTKENRNQLLSLRHLNEKDEKTYNNVVKYLFEHAQKYTIHQYKKSKKLQLNEGFVDPPLFSVLTYKALAYTACHMALLKSILSYETAKKKQLFQFTRTRHIDADMFD
jgi:ankyrin repeat protein